MDGWTGECRWFVGCPRHPNAHSWSVLWTHKHLLIRLLRVSNTYPPVWGYISTAMRVLSLWLVALWSLWWNQREFTTSTKTIHLYRLYQLLTDFFFSRYTHWLILWLDENLCWSVRIQDFGVGRLNPEGSPREPCIEHSLVTPIFLPKLRRLGDLQQIGIFWNSNDRRSFRNWNFTHAKLSVGTVNPLVFMGFI